MKEYVEVPQKQKEMIHEFKPPKAMLVAKDKIPDDVQALGYMTLQLEELPNLQEKIHSTIADGKHDCILEVRVGIESLTPAHGDNPERVSLRILSVMDYENEKAKAIAGSREEY